MQKIKYIIIFTLTLALGILYIQITDYQNITNTLLSENTNSNTQTKSLQNTIQFLEDQNTELNDKIISLQEELAIIQIKLNNTNFIIDTNTTQNFLEPQNSFTLPQKNLIESPVDMTPNITLDEENKITGFGLEYKQKF